MTALFMFSGSEAGLAKITTLWKLVEKTIDGGSNGRVGEVWHTMKPGDCPSDISRLSQM